LTKLEQSKRWEFEVRPIIKNSINGPQRWGLFIKGDMYLNARAVIYDGDIAEELKRQLDKMGEK